MKVIMKWCMSISKVPMASRCLVRFSKAGKSFRVVHRDDRQGHGGQEEGHCHHLEQTALPNMPRKRWA